MAQSSINVTEGSGKRLNTWDRTISSVLVQDQFVLPGEYPLASYTISAAPVSNATASDHLLQIMAGSTNYVRIRRIWIEQLASATAVTLNSLLLLRLTTAGTGGTSITPSKLDLGDAAAGATAMTLPTAKGTESTEIRRTALVYRQTIASTATQPEESIDWKFGEGALKPLIIPAGTSNGIVIKNGSAVASATSIIFVELVETAWLGA